SGQMAAVGFELYCRLLAEAVERLRAAMRGEPPPPPREDAEVTIDLPVSAHIPESYVPDLNLRLALYQRLTEARLLEEVPDIEKELMDRFGPPPPAVRSLLDVVRLRALALEASVRSIATEQGQIVVRMKEGRTLPALESRLPRGVYPGRTLVRIDTVGEGTPWREPLQEVLEALAGKAAVA
ncbi:MAG: TRCF domain-containing protein, partial [Dehalococcoidia bacterium]